MGIILATLKSAGIAHLMRERLKSVANGCEIILEEILRSLFGISSGPGDLLQFKEFSSLLTSSGEI